MDVIGRAMFFAFSFLAICALCVVGVGLCFLVVWLFLKLFNQRRAANILMGVILWMTVSFLLPFKAKALGCEWKKVYLWLLTLVSPAAIITYLLVLLVLGWDGAKTVPYEELRLTSSAEMTSITEIENFPAFEYVGNIREDGYQYDVQVKYHFSEEQDVDGLLRKLEETYTSDDNYLWTKSGDSYICRRGWDDIVVKKPNGVSTVREQVEITVDSCGFTMAYGDCNTDITIDVDSLIQLTEIRLQHYDIVNCSRFESLDDRCTLYTIRLNSKPSRKLIRAIERSEEWELKEDGVYEFFNEDKYMHIKVNPKNRFIEFQYL